MDMNKLCELIERNAENYLGDPRSPPEDRIEKFLDEFYKIEKSFLIPNTFIRCTIADDASKFKYKDNIVCSKNVNSIQFEKVYNFQGWYFLVKAVCLNM